jgi:hypothetical protein
MCFPERLRETDQEICLVSVSPGRDSWGSLCQKALVCTCVLRKTDDDALWLQPWCNAYTHILQPLTQLMDSTKPTCAFGREQTALNTQTVGVPSIWTGRSPSHELFCKAAICQCVLSLYSWIRWWHFLHTVHNVYIAVTHSYPSMQWHFFHYRCTLEYILQNGLRHLTVRCVGIRYCETCP